MGSSEDDGENKPWNSSTKGNDLVHDTNSGKAKEDQENSSLK